MVMGYDDMQRHLAASGRAPYDYELPTLNRGDRVAVVLRNGEMVYDTVRDYREEPRGSGNYILETDRGPRWSGLCGRRDPRAAPVLRPADGGEVGDSRS